MLKEKKLFTVAALKKIFTEVIFLLIKDSKPLKNVILFFDNRNVTIYMIIYTEQSLDM